MSTQTNENETTIIPVQAYVLNDIIMHVGTAQECMKHFAENNFGGRILSHVDALVLGFEYAPDVTIPMDEAEPQLDPVETDKLMQATVAEVEAMTEPGDGLVYVEGVGRVARAVADAINAARGGDETELKSTMQDGDVVHTGADGTVSQLAVQRIERHQDALKSIGIHHAPPVYAAGTRVIGWGKDNFRVSREEWRNQPAFEESGQAIIDAIQAEERVDLHTSLHNLRMQDDGIITSVSTGQKLATEAWGLKRLLPFMRFPEGHMYDGKMVAEGAGNYLMRMDPGERAHRFNRDVMRADDRAVVLRTRSDGNGGRALYATVSQKYDTTMGGDVALDIMMRALEGRGYKGSVIYDPETTRVTAEASYHADKVVDLSAGDVFKMGLEFQTRDDGGSSFKGGPFSVRNLCLNLIILDRAKGEQVKFVHKGRHGDSNRLVREVQAAFTKSQRVFDRFADEWGILRGTSIKDVSLWGKTFTSVEDALTYAVEDNRLDVSLKDSILVEALLKGFGKEPGESLADMINAVTRAAHEEEWGNAALERELEQIAGRVLVPVLVEQANEPARKTFGMSPIAQA